MTPPRRVLEEMDREWRDRRRWRDQLAPGHHPDGDNHPHIPDTRLDEMIDRAVDWMVVTIIILVAVMVIRVAWQVIT